MLVVSVDVLWEEVVWGVMHQYHSCRIMHRVIILLPSGRIFNIRSLSVNVLVKLVVVKIVAARSVARGRYTRFSLRRSSSAETFLSDLRLSAFAWYARVHWVVCRFSPSASHALKASR